MESLLSLFRILNGLLLATSFVLLLPFVLSLFFYASDKRKPNTTAAESEKQIEPTLVVPVAATLPSSSTASSSAAPKNVQDLTIADESAQVNKSKDDNTKEEEEVKHLKLRTFLSTLWVANSAYFACNMARVAVTILRWSPTSSFAIVIIFAACLGIALPVISGFALPLYHCVIDDKFKRLEPGYARASFMASFGPFVDGSKFISLRSHRVAYFLEFGSTLIASTIAGYIPTENCLFFLLIILAAHLGYCAHFALVRPLKSKLETMLTICNGALLFVMLACSVILVVAQDGSPSQSSAPPAALLTILGLATLAQSLVSIGGLFVLVFWRGILYFRRHKVLPPTPDRTEEEPLEQRLVEEHGGERVENPLQH